MTFVPASVARRVRTAALALAVLVGVALTAPAAAPARADTAPPAGSNLPATVSTDLLPTVQIDGVVWSQAVVGNRVFAGGDWDNARPAGNAPGVGNIAQKDLLSYNLSTGVLDSWRPIVDGQILAVAASPDGSTLYIGGDFLNVNHQRRERLAAFDVATGALKSWNPRANNRVYALAATESAVYAGGWFTAAGGVARTSVAALHPSSGAALSFAPAVAGSETAAVRAIAVSPDRTKVMLGGQFETVNGPSSPGGYGLAIVDAATGKRSQPLAANSVVRNARNAAAILSLTAAGGSVYGTGFHYKIGGPTDGTLEGAFKVTWGGALEWIEDCHGDSYSVWSGQGAVYVAGHPHYCGNIGGFEQTDPLTYHHTLAFTTDARGGPIGREPYDYVNFAGQPKPQWLNWFPAWTVGQKTKQYQGPWHVTGNADYVVFGGEFTTLNNKQQQGLARFARPGLAPNLDGPRLSGSNFVPKAQSFAQGIRLSWPANYDRDSEQLTYKLIRNGATATPIFTTTLRSTFWLRPTLSFLDTTAVRGQTYTYSLQVSDPGVNGKPPNVAKGAAISVTAAGGASLSSYDQLVLNDGPQNYWRLAETSGTTVADTAGAGTATRQPGVTLGVPGGRTNDAGTAYRFSGTSSGYVSSNTAEVGKQVFSIEAWFKTSSTKGGKIVSFGNARTGGSTSADRQIYLSDSGQVIFGTVSGSVRAVYGSFGRNDGRWHHVVATLDGSGLKLYVDGKLEVSRSDYYQALRYNGYWRIGGDALSGWPGNPSSPYLAGDIDNVAIYDKALTAAQIAAHKAAG